MKAQGFLSRASRQPPVQQRKKTPALGAGLPTSPTVRCLFLVFFTLPAALVFIPEG